VQQQHGRPRPAAHHLEVYPVNLKPLHSHQVRQPHKRGTSVTDPHDLPGLKAWDCPPDLRDEWDQIDQGIAASEQDDDPKRYQCQVLLKLDALVGGHEYVESRFGGPSQQFAILDTSPTLLLYRTDIVLWKFALEPSR
jgi:hypothetical protein